MVKFSILAGLLLLNLIFTLLFGWFAEKNKSRILEATPTPTASPIPQGTSLAEWRYILTPTEECPLPCWWGIIPGETTFENAEEILLHKFDGLEIMRADITNLGRQTLTILNFTIPSNNPELEYVSILHYSMGGINGIVDFIGFDTLAEYDVMPYFEITNLLDLHGIPDVIKLYIDSDGSPIWFYWESIEMGIMYLPDYSEENTAQRSRYCLNLVDISGFAAFIQDPQLNRPIEEIVHSVRHQGLKPLNEVSSMTNEEFSDTLLENDGCLFEDSFIE